MKSSSRSRSSSHSRPRTTTTTAATESPLSPVLLSFLAVTFLLQLYNLRSRPWALAFVAATYSNFLLLCWCIEAHDRVPQGSRRRRAIRAAVWLLSSSLIVTISGRVAGMMPLAVKVLVWTMAGATVSGTAYGFFVYCPKPEEEEDNNTAATAAATRVSLEP